MGDEKRANSFDLEILINDTAVFESTYPRKPCKIIVRVTVEQKCSLSLRLTQNVQIVRP